MLLEQQVQDKINEAIEQAYLSFLISIIGYDTLSADDKRKASLLGLVQLNRPLVESLYSIAKDRHTIDRKPTKLRDLIAMANLAGHLPLTDAQIYSLTHAKQELYDIIQNAKAEYVKKIRQAILAANAEARNTELSQTLSVHERYKIKAAQIGTLLVGIGSILEKVQDTFEKGATGALTNLINNAVVDRIAIDSMINHVKVSDARVFKTVINDGKLCAWCAKFYLNKDGTPRIFSLAELLANGSNDGLAKSEWKPVVGKTHVRCRCQLHFESPRMNQE